MMITIVLLCTTTGSFLMGMSEDYAQYLTFVKQRTMQLADVQPPLTDHQMLKLIDESKKYFPQESLNLEVAFCANDTQAADHTLRVLVNNLLKNTVGEHRHCKDSFCYVEAAETYCNFVYENKYLKVMHKFNKHQLKVMLRHLIDTTDDTKKLFQLILCLHSNQCSTQEKNQIVFLSKNLCNRWKDEMDEHKNCIGYGYCNLE